MSRQSIIKGSFFLIFSVLLIGLGWFANIFYHNHAGIFYERRVNLKGFKYISPLLDVELPEGYDVRHEPIPFKHKIVKYVDQQIKFGTVQDMSVYYRDLSDGPWFGINEKVKYNPASMMKLPILIAWLKRAEKDPSVLQSKLTYYPNSMTVPEQGFKPAKTLMEGASYTVEDLLRYMMYYSDNKALFLLLSNLRSGEYEYILQNMDVAYEKDSDGEDLISVHSYSGFLRILYNASFLNREMSEKALELMSFQDFPIGIAAGIPKGTKLASKFGEFSVSKYPDIQQLHEFGIVYHPKGPYILGVLTRGNNVDKQADIIKAVSEMVYNSVNESIIRTNK